MTEPLVVHVVNAASSRGDLWAEVQRQNALIRELRAVIRAHAQTIRDKQDVIEEAHHLCEMQHVRVTTLDRILTTSIRQKAELRTHIEQLEAKP